MKKRAAGALKIAGAITALVGAAVSVVYFFQPWRTCPYEDTSVGCAMLPQDSTAMLVAVIATVLGVAIFLLGLAVARTQTANRRAV